MVEVGVRELRDNLSRWLDAVKAGEEVLVTERGRPVARIVGAGTPSSYDRLVAEGIITLASRPRRSSSEHRVVRARGSVSDLVSEQRR